MNKPDDVQSRVRRVVKGLETMKYEEGSRKVGKEASLSEEKTDQDCENHLKIVEGFLHTKEGRYPLLPYRKNKEQERY